MSVRARLASGFATGEDAQDLIEYALLAGLIALVAIVGVTQVGNAVNGVLWQTVTTGLNNAL